MGQHQHGETHRCTQVLRAAHPTDLPGGRSPTLDQTTIDQSIHHKENTNQMDLIPSTEVVRKNGMMETSQRQVRCLLTGNAAVRDQPIHREIAMYVT